MAANVCVSALNYLFNGDGLRKKYQAANAVRIVSKEEAFHSPLFIGLEEMIR